MKYGAVDIERHNQLARDGIDVRVIVAGVDVTNRCIFFDDSASPPIAFLYRLDANGKKFIDGGSAATEIVHDFEIREQ